MQLGLYAHPFDAPDFAGLHALGYRELALASAYHAGRWLVPRAGAGLVRFLEDGIVHAATGRLAGTLQPEPSSTPHFAALAAAAAAHGFAVSAWTVFCHNSRLGRLHPDACVRNALGDVYRYALCPARREVREYVLGLARALAAIPGVTTLECEALGWMGHKHGSHHDKSSFTPDAHLDFLLSYCFCDVCTAVVGAGARARVAELLHARLVAADALQDARLPVAQLAADLGAAYPQMLGHRAEVYARLLRDLRAAVPAAVRLALHVQPDPHFTGSQLGAPLAAVGGLVDECVLTSYGESAEQIEASWQRLDPAGAKVRLAIWPKAPHFRSEEDLRRVQHAAAGKGAVGLRIYHLSLLPERTVARVARTLHLHGCGP